MANEYLLKMIVTRLQTVAADTETLCETPEPAGRVLRTRDAVRGGAVRAARPALPRQRAIQADAAKLVSGSPTTWRFRRPPGWHAGIGRRRQRRE